MPLMLTKTERKKIRTQGRVAREKEKQENIKLGLLEPPKPKVKSVPSLPPPPPVGVFRGCAKVSEAVRAAVDADDIEYSPENY